MPQNSDPSLMVAALPAELAGERPVYFALGTFDGVHLGHQAVLRQLRSAAAAVNALPAVLFFEPFPRQVLDPENAPLRLSSPERKLALLASGGAQAVVRLPFTRELAALTPAEFLERFFFQVPKLKIAGFCVGEDWRFGAGNAGDVDTLRQLAAARGIEVTAVPPVRHGDACVSSTRIRSAVANGELALAAELLGHPYILEGEVIPGNGIASTRLDCPTANLADEKMQLPPFGVYAAWARVAGSDTLYPSITYIGDAPTIRGAGNGCVILEIHLLGVQCDIYGQHIEIEPVKFLRESRLFPSAEELMAQIQRDLAAARAVLHG